MVELTLAISGNRNAPPWIGISSFLTVKTFVDKSSGIVIQEPAQNKMPVLSPIEGKGKQVMVDEAEQSPIPGLGSSSSRMKIICVCEKPVEDGSILNPTLVNKSSYLTLEEENFNPWKKSPYIKVNLPADCQILIDDGSVVKLYEPNVKANSEKLQFSLVVKKKSTYIKVNLPVDSQFLTDDGSAVKLYEPNVKANYEKLQFSLVVKLFGRHLPIQLVATELRWQWMMFGKFHLTNLGSDWVLCSFFSIEVMENNLLGGPWFVNGHLIGLDKWNSDFNPNFLKGLSSLIWIRMPNLSLYCWDEVNVSRIASSIEEPMLIDGDMFQWGRREFVRICV
ncbi:hypothetical protein KFK09_000424 [Dendrobium nobile]|uniref:DUF4283 domain-containing protein n=1 Tax=Dendrobium nobile TaxID=94219 RepID=A0A8T3CB28_DENNO|nr:hypothetical protein KFK09_000424 [Dendrobium nobile]